MFLTCMLLASPVQHKMNNKSPRPPPPSREKKKKKQSPPPPPPYFCDSLSMNKKVTSSNRKVKKDYRVKSIVSPVESNKEPVTGIIFILYFTI